jgi:hypothetical protein
MTAGCLGKIRGARRQDTGATKSRARMCFLNTDRCWLLTVFSVGGSTLLFPCAGLVVAGLRVGQYTSWYDQHPPPPCGV